MLVGVSASSTSVVSLSAMTSATAVRFAKLPILPPSTSIAVFTAMLAASSALSEAVIVPSESFSMGSAVRSAAVNAAPSVPTISFTNWRTSASVFPSAIRVVSGLRTNFPEEISTLRLSFPWKAVPAWSPPLPTLMLILLPICRLPGKINLPSAPETFDV